MFVRLFRSTLAATPAQPRDHDGRFIPHRAAARRRALDMAMQMGRDDLVARLDPTKLPPATPVQAGRDAGLTRSPAGTSAEAGSGRVCNGANDRDVANLPKSEIAE